MSEPLGLSKVVGLPENARSCLNAEAIFTDQEFWEKLSQKPDFLSIVKFRDDQERSQVIESMARHSVQAGMSMTRGPIVTHIPDIIVAVAALALLVAASSRPWRPPTATPRPTVRVVAEWGIPAFQIIGEKDVAAETNTSTGNPTILADVIGRYSSEPLTNGTEIDSSKLASAASTDLARLILLQVSFTTDSSLFSLKPAQRIAIAASSPGQPPSGVVVEDVYLLRVQPRNDGIAAVIGTSADNVRALAPFLTSGKLVPLVTPR